MLNFTSGNGGGWTVTVSETPYEIRIRAYTPAHDGFTTVLNGITTITIGGDELPNELWSEYSPTVSATTLGVDDTIPNSPVEIISPEHTIHLPIIAR